MTEIVIKNDKDRAELYKSAKAIHDGSKESGVEMTPGTGIPSLLCVVAMINGIAVTIREPVFQSIYQNKEINMWL